MEHKDAVVDLFRSHMDLAGYLPLICHWKSSAPG